MSHSVYLSVGIDDDSTDNSVSNGKTLDGQMAQALDKITLREEFEKMNE